MARLVQQRSDPPYLLIIATFLFLVAAVLAVLFYMDGDKLKKDLAGLRQEKNTLATPRELAGGTIRKMVERYSNPPRGERTKTVVAQFAEREEQASRMIAGAAMPIDQALATGNGALAAVGRQGDLTTEVKAIYSKLMVTILEVEDLKGQLAQKNDLLADAERSVGELRKELDTRLAASAKTVSDLQAAAQKRQKEHETQADQQKAEWAQTRARLDQELAQKTQELLDMDREKNQLERQVVRLQEKMRKLTAPNADPITMATRADGEIRTVVGEDRICYINLGSANHIVPGLFFSVYDPKGIPKDKDAWSKGRIVVTKVGRDTSECRIVEENPQSPIMPGDLFANLAFDSVRSFTFVVEGNFDLHGQGFATSDGNKEVKVFIRRHGGIIADKVTIETDFVILGSKPEKPAELGDEASIHVQETHRRNVEIYNRYRNVEDDAEKMRKLTLNTNQFLAFVGYVPAQTLKD